MRGYVAIKDGTAGKEEISTCRLIKPGTLHLALQRYGYRTGGLDDVPKLAWQNQSLAKALARWPGRAQ